jgi:hypothetical protein
MDERRGQLGLAGVAAGNLLLVGGLLDGRMTTAGAHVGGMAVAVVLAVGGHVRETAIDLPLPGGQATERAVTWLLVAAGAGMLLAGVVLLAASLSG